jgi:hypothetical protein
VTGGSHIYGAICKKGDDRRTTTSRYAYIRPRSTSVEARRRETETSTGDAFEFSFQFFQARIGRCFRIDESRLHVEVEMALPPLDRHADETKREHRSAFRGGRFSEAPALFEVCQYAMSV